MKPGAPAAPNRPARISPRTLAATLAGVGSLAVYAATMSRSVGFIDRGELAAVAATLGIAHPTGYPLLTLLGNAAVRFAPSNPLIALNALAALWVAAGVSILVLLYDGVLARTTQPGAQGAGRRAACAALAALVTGFSGTWWQQANGFEAYALQALLLPLVCWTFLRYIALETGSSPVHGNGLRGAAFAFTLGLSMSNHLTTVVLAPALLAAFIARRGLGIGAWRSLGALVPVVALGLTPYLYLPLRVAQAPRFSWGDPDTAWRFWTHVTGRQYQVWMFSDAEAAGQQIAFIFGRMPWEWVGLGLVLAALGCAAWRRHGGYLLVLALAGGTSVLWACAYAIRDIDPYVMPWTMVIGMLAASGLAAIAARAGTRAAVVVGGFCVALALGVHWRSCDERDHHMVEDYAHNLLSELPEHAVLVSAQWDHLVSASYYLQEIGGLRRDVTIIDPELMRRSWYVRELARRESALVGGFASEVERFEREVEPFERGRRFDPAPIQSAYLAMFAGLERSVRASGRRLYATWEVRQPVWEGLERVPMGLSSELVSDTGYVALLPPRYRYRPWDGRRDHYVATLARNYAEALAERADYEARHGRLQQARGMAALGADFAPRFTLRDVPPLPLDGRKLVAASLERFRQLRRAAGVGGS